MDTVRTLVSAQLLVTVFLAVLLWSLHARLHREEYNRWWVGAWTLFAMFLAVGRVALAFPPSWNVAQESVVALATLLGFLVAPLLVYGAASYRSPGTLTRRGTLLGIGVALALGAITFVISLRWTGQPFLGFSFRNGARALVLAAALLFCARVFLQRVWTHRSLAALVTGMSFLGYSLTQSVYAAALLTRVLHPSGSEVVGSAALVASLRLLYVDVVLLGGICLGMILLLVEAHQESERSLRESLTRGREAAEENTALQLEMRNRHEVEQRLGASEDKYRDLVENSDDLICTHDLDGKLLSVNRSVARCLGYKVDELIGMSLRDIIAPDVQHEFDGYLRDIQRDLVSKGMLKVVTKGGTRRIWSFRNSLRLEGVTTPIVRGMARDVTEQLRAERALKRSEEKFSIAFRSSPSAKAIVSMRTGRFLDINAAFESLTGYDREELLQQSLLDAGIWSDPGDEAVLQDVLTNNGHLTAREMLVRHCSGRVATVVFSAEVVHVGGEKCALLAGLDTTARKEAESRQRAILRALPDWVFLMDATGVYLEFYGTERGLLAPPSAFIGRHFTEVLPPELSAKVKVMIDGALHSDETVTMEYSLHIGDEDRYYEVRAVRTDRDRILCLVRDVTDQSRAEYRATELREELAHAGRAMTLGVLSGSLAHEVNQPLAAISANAFVAMRLLGAQPPAVGKLQELLADIMSDTNRIDDVLRKLRQLLRKDRHDFALVDINAIVGDVLKLMNSNLLERQTSIDVELGADLPVVCGDRVQLQQVVLNLLMNAADAVGTVPTAERRIRLTTEVVDDRVVVSVMDRGATVSDAAFGTMFEPFFTTKPDGMGLGLSISQTILEAHGGEIFARRNADRGITCWFALEGVESPSLGGMDQRVALAEARAY